MPNTNLPTNTTAGSIGHVANHQVLHGEMNLLTRDTGWRTIPLSGGWAVGGASPIRQIRRLHNQVFIRLRGLDGSAATVSAFSKFGSTDDGATLDLGFRGMSGMRSPLMLAPGGEQFYLAINSGNGLISSILAGMTPGASSQSYEWSYYTDMAWPTFLPAAA